MSVESAKQDVKVDVSGKDFVIIGGDRVEVSPDGKKVTAYTNDGVETKAASGAAAQGISISADFNTVVLNGATIERAADGHLVISTPGTVTFTKPGPANDTTVKGKTAPEIGDEMTDGTIYAGISPDTHKPMYTTPRDEPLTVTFKGAATQAGVLNMTNALDHHDWRVPTIRELGVLWENRNKGKLKGTFYETGSDPAGWYCSSSPNGNFGAWAQRFSDGYSFSTSRTNDSSLRLVR